MLIVPYGIETPLDSIYVTSKFVLIVPYGIETKKERIQSLDSECVNCTLWN